MLLVLLLGCPTPPDTATSTDCGLTMESASSGGPLVVETGGQGLIRTRALAIDGADAAHLVVTGPFEVVDAAGAVVEDVEPPVEVYVRALEPGQGSVQARQGKCSADLDLQAVAAHPIVGRPRTVAPMWQSETVQWAGETLWLGLDPQRYLDRVGAGFDAYVVEHRTAEEWAADSALVGQFGTPVEGTVEGEVLQPLELGAPDAGGDARGLYDVVVDFDRDGQLGPDDLIQGLGEPGLAVLGELSEPGPHAVETEDVSGGRFLGERVYWPTDLAALGPRPLVVISHGNGHEYTWYDYLGEHLASWGFVVMSHQNNTEPGIETASTTTLTNTDWFLGHLDEIGGGALVGLIDGTRIGWIGHSRGGEGIVRAYDRIVDAEYAPENFGAEDVRFLASIAPTVFNTVSDTDPHDRPYFLIAGTADGDVTGGVEAPELQFFRIWERATGEKAAAYVHGASHNDFNCCGFADGQGPNLIGRDEAQVIARTYLLAFARGILDDDPSLFSVFREEYSGFTPLSFSEADLVATGWRDAPEAGNGILDDFQSENDATVASSGGAVSCTGVELVEGPLKDGDRTLTWSDGDPMNGMTHNGVPPDAARGAVFSWSEGTTAAWAVEVPASLRDTSAYTAVSVSVTQRTRHPETDAWGGALAFGLTLVDSEGVESTVNVQDQALIPLPYARVGSGKGRGWANEFVTVRVALGDFAVGSPIDLTRIKQVRLDFGEAHGSPEGAVGLDNVEFVR